MNILRINSKKVLFLTLLILNLAFLVIHNTVVAEEFQDDKNSSNLAETLVELPEIHFFYSTSCPNCGEQKKFHEKLLNKYPNLIINEYDVSRSKTSSILNKFASEYGAERYTGLVPLTFIGDSFIVGFNTEGTTGLHIEEALIINTPGLLSRAEACDEDDDSEICTIDLGSSFNQNRYIDSESYTILEQATNLPAFLSRWGLNLESLSLPILSILLGIFDGFNICSLGALMLILSLVLGFKSRKKVLLFGGLFILITGIAYASLIFIWFSLFRYIAPIIPVFEIIIGIIGLIGGYIFLRQYFRFKKYGPTCEMSNSKLINGAVKRLQTTFKNSKNGWTAIIGVIGFAIVVTILEFPCSAVIPVAFAAILADAGVTAAAQSFYLLLFMLFYLLDELIVFLIAVFSLRMWTGGNTMKTRLVLIQAIVFIAIALFYIGRLVV